MRYYLLPIVLASMLLPIGLLAATGITTGWERDQVLRTLRDGNARYVAGHPHAWNADGDLRTSLAVGQHPKACIVTCSDSRVSPEILFDQSLGDLFVIRVAGNVVSPEVAGSCEYAVEHLHVPVVVVLGHTNCGAVTAAVTDPDCAGSLGSLIRRITPAVEAAQQKGFWGNDLLAAAVNENARLAAGDLLQYSRFLEESVMNGEVTVLCALYDIRTGGVTWQTQIIAAAQAPPETEVKAAPEPAPPVADKAKTEKNVKSKRDRTNSYTSRHHY